MSRKRAPIVLDRIEREELERRAGSPKGRADEAKIARVVLLLSEGACYTEIQQRVGCSAPFVSKWKRRFLAERLAVLCSWHAGLFAAVRNHAFLPVSTLGSQAA